ncbi:DUF2066 domain-containing protein [Thalassotalea sp. M1531]|uniref:DUF2066 domain-containing protein n=1 Tax=Thalassotalea algicola TaxID=2716224 RepID=A0A7Y0LDK8_9GAMM|nr:DUF2066 domain-containing protein [Thalassotalea algicola]NMP32486.1 DUF2066 domain-containing protein [Thalassotalea algicola]
MNLIQLHKMLKLITFLTALLLPSLVFAVEVTDLYQAKVAVDSQASNARNVAIKQAMASVMIKVGGDESVLSNNTVKQQLKRYNQYLTQYRYERDQKQLFLVALFDENKINVLFQQANLPLWGSLRPQILVWLLEENKLERNILSESGVSELPQQIREFSQQRGLPLLLPLMDLEDSLSINITDLWGRFASEAQQQSSRYFVDATLIIRISNSSLLSEPPADNECEGVLCQEQVRYALDWSLISEQQQFGQLLEGTSTKALLNKALIDVAQVIYQGYASSTDLSNELVIDVANVTSLKTYVEISRFLNELSAVEEVTLVSAQQQVRRFKLKLLGSKKALLASLKLNDQLQQYIDPLVGEEPDANPVFYWRP